MHEITDMHANKNGKYTKNSLYTNKRARARAHTHAHQPFYLNTCKLAYNAIIQEYKRTDTVPVSARYHTRVLLRILEQICPIRITDTTEGYIWCR